jgi:crossover junction endodeoxyribonuclease RuvC
MSVYIGIDPGLTGAVAAIDGAGHLLRLADTPTLVVRSGRKDRNEYQLGEMVDILLPYSDQRGDAFAAIEAVNAFPGQGVTSMFRLGYGLGLWEGITAALGISLEKVQPQRWKKTMLNGMGKLKGAAMLKAQRLFPTAELRLKKHEGRAEALLIAEWLRRTRR